jgi:hypothetical protein
MRRLALSAAILLLAAPLLHAQETAAPQWRHMKPGGNSGVFVWSNAILGDLLPSCVSERLPVPGAPDQNEEFPINTVTQKQRQPGSLRGGQPERSVDRL